MDYKVYQILLLFAFYSTLGWAVEQGIYGIKGKVVKRGVLRGPTSFMYGIGALMVLYILAPYSHNFVYALCGSILICVFLELVILILIKLLSGISLWKYYFFFPLMGGVLGIALIQHINPIVSGVMNMFPNWLSFILLIMYYVIAIPDFIDGVDLLRCYRRNLKRLKNSNVTHNEYGELVCDFLEPYNRWLKAYPHFKEQTLKCIFEGHSLEEIAEIKEAMKNHLK